MSGSSNAGTSWGLALSYLAWCPQHGGDAADIMMEALPVSLWVCAYAGHMLALFCMAWCPQHGGDAADIMMEVLPVCLGVGANLGGGGGWVDVLEC